MPIEDTKEEIKRRIDIVELISQYIPVRRAGRRFKALCPFHQEKTPSLSVDPAAGLWHCFGCGAGGDLFSFLQQIEGISFSEAGERLAERCGLTWRIEPGEQARVERSKLLRRAVESATCHFEDNLRSTGGKAALDYLYKRGFSDETITGFRLGFAVEAWDELLKFLSSKGLAAQLMREAGLVKRSERGSDYDVFRNRIMFPISDAAGAVIGFGGRAMDPAESAKYLNSPDTPLFSKSRNLYALAHGRQALVAAKSAIVVEGYTDVLALHQAGLKNAVATLGTAMTADHLLLLRRYVERVILCFDADAAGMAAALRNIDLFEGSTLEARVMLLPQGIDPDQSIRAHGVEQFQQLAQQAVDLVEYRLEMVFGGHRDGGSEGLARAAREAVDVLRHIPDRTRREEFVVRAADRWAQGQPERVGGMQAALRMEMQRRTSKGQRRRAKTAGSGRRDRSFVTETIVQDVEYRGAILERLERELLCAALESRDFAERVFAVLCPDDFLTPEHQAIARAIGAQLQVNGEYEPQRVPDELSAQEGTYRRAVELLLAEPPDDLTNELLEASARKLRKHRRVTGLREEYELQSAESPLVTEENSVEDFQKLQQRIAELMKSDEFTHDHPDYQRYVALAARFHGKGQFDFLEGPGAIQGTNRVESPEDLSGQQNNAEQNDERS